MDMESQQPKQTADDKGATAGSILIDLAGKDSRDGQRKLFDYEKQLLDDSFAAGQNSPVFHKQYISALRLALKTKNRDLFELLLEKDASHNVFKDESDILQLAICSHKARWRPEHEDLKAKIEILISYGATIHGFDDEGKSPLYYTCICGFPKTFKLLIELGADYSALFDPFRSGDIDNPPKNSEKSNLLQIALDARQENERGGSIPYMWQKGPVKWEPIVMYLLDSGLSCPPDYPSLVKFLHVSCYQGNLPHVEKLLDWGVNHTARAGRSDNRDYVFGSALHVAAALGQRDVALCLLKYGADPRAKYSCITFLHQKALMTPVELASKSRLVLRPNPQKILEVCEILVDLGTDDQDSQILLEACINAGNEEMSKKLLEKGIRIQEIPVCSELGVVRLLLDYGCQIDDGKFQRHAVKLGLVDMLRFLVEKQGPLLPLSDFGHIAFEVIRGNHLNMLKYLVSEYGFQIDSIFPCYPNAASHINLLQRACDEYRLDSIKLLLELGADVNCPGLPEVVLVHFQKQLQSANFSAVASRMPILRLLLHHSHEDLKDWVVVDPKDTADSGVKSKRRQVQSQLLNLKHTESEIAAAQSPSQLTVERSNGASTEQLLESTATTSWREAYTASQLLLETKRETYVYHSLPGPQDIRVLSLEPSKSIDEPIRGQLVVMNLSQKPFYEALSYVRGGQSKTAGILLQDTIFEVSQNLWLALRRLRYEDKPRLIWIDALCLDQENLQERNQQATIMRDIYQMADKVFIWLGEEAENSHLVFEHLKKWNQYREDYAAGRVRSTDPFGESHINPPQYQGETRDAFHKLCKRPWFFRTWVIQEVSLAKNAIVMCGSDTESFKLLMRPSSFRMNGYHPLQGIDGPTHYYNLSNIGSCSRVNNLKPLIKYSGYCEASDPKDKVYSLLGLFQQQIIPIDYSLSVADIYRMFTQKVIEETRSLSILHWMGTQRWRDDLNTWVQDFSVSNPIGILPRIYGSYTCSLNYPDRILPGLQFNATDLRVKGKYIEAIQDIGPELKAYADNILGSDSFLETLYSWESLAAELVSRKGFKNHVTCAFLDTLAADDTHWTVKKDHVPEFSNQTEYFAAWYERYGTDVLAEADPEFFQEIAFIREWCQKLNAEDEQRFVSRFAHSMEIACYSRCFFITDQGSMGLAPPRAKPGDELVYLPGGVYPFVIRKREDETHELIGDCFLYGLDVYKLFDDQSKEMKEFVLR